jgi:hypothetical protein
VSRLIQRFPTAVASACYTLAVAIAFAPFWSGRVLMNPVSDMNRVYPFRLYAAEYFKQHGSIPQWIPYLFGGMPFAANPTFGDTFYPGFLLRLLLPVDQGMTLGMMVHIALAGVFAYLFLRQLRLDWTSAFVGGAAYLFTGMVVSLVTAGHDGKIIVSALLPLALLALHRGVTTGRWRPYLGFGAVVGLSLLSPHVQLTYYLLMAAGFFWLFLAFLSGDRPAAHRWWASGLLFAAGVGVGFALDAIQLIPFAQYIGFSPRGAPGSTSSGWEYATLFSMPPEELLNVVWPSFSGMIEHYWGRNSLKLHSEYLGVAVLMLASFAFRAQPWRRLTWFFVFLAAYGTLFAFGGHTPFYWLPYTLLPGIKLTRGAGMIFFLVSFSTAVLAAFGTQAILNRDQRLPLGRVVGWLAVLGVGSLLAFAGGWKGLMLSLGGADALPRIEANYATFTFDAARAVLVAALVAGLVWARRTARLPEGPWGLALGLVILLDLWSVERRQIRFSPPARELFAPDGIVRAVQADSTRLFRILGVAPAAGYFQDNYLGIHHLRSVLGYQGTEIHRYDELLGGKNEWRNALNPNIWRVLAVKYLVVSNPVNHPDLEAVGEGPLPTYEGQRAYLYRYRGYQPYARLVAAALKVPDDQAAAVIPDPRFDPRRILLVAPDAPVGATSLAALPDTVPVAVRAVELRPGAFRFELAQPAPRESYLFVSENYYPGWRAWVDGRPAPVARAQLSLMAVPVPAGARAIELSFTSPRYRLGRAISIATAIVLAGLLLWRGPSGAGATSAPASSRAGGRRAGGPDRRRPATETPEGGSG